MKINFDPEGHTYHDDAGSRYPSVTHIIRTGWPIDTRWYKEEYTRRGKDVHAILAAIDSGVIPAAELYGHELSGYITAWYTYIDDEKMAWSGIEEPKASETHGYAGTIDRWMTKDGKTHVRDIKTGRPEGWHELQLAAYAVLLEDEGHLVETIGGVYIRENGKYQEKLYDLNGGRQAWLSYLCWSRYREARR